MSKKLVPVGVTNHHIHLCQEHIDILFGKGYQLTHFKDLSQPGQYATNEKVKVIGPKGSVNLRVLGPVREYTQVEISVSDQYITGLDAPVRYSGKLNDSAGCILKGPHGEIEIQSGLIVTVRHIHFHTTDAQKWDIKDNDWLKVKVDGDRGLIFDNVFARVKDSYALEFHVDLDEANAAKIKTGDMVEIID